MTPARIDTSRAETGLSRTISFGSRPGPGRLQIRWRCPPEELARVTGGWRVPGPARQRSSSRTRADAASWHAVGAEALRPGCRPPGAGGRGRPSDPGRRPTLAADVAPAARSRPFVSWPARRSGPPGGRARVRISLMVVVYRSPIADEAQRLALPMSEGDAVDGVDGATVRRNTAPGSGGSGGRGRRPPAPRARASRGWRAPAARRPPGPGTVGGGGPAPRSRGGGGRRPGGRDGEWRRGSRLQSRQTTAAFGSGGRRDSRREVDQDGGFPSTGVRAWRLGRSEAKKGREPEAGHPGVGHAGRRCRRRRLPPDARVQDHLPRQPASCLGSHWRPRPSWPSPAPPGSGPGM